MPRVALVLALLACACGRVGFDPRPSSPGVDASAAGDATGDAINPVGPQTVDHRSNWVNTGTAAVVPLPTTVTAADLLLVITSTSKATAINAPIDTQGNAYALVASAAGVAMTDSRIAIYAATSATTNVDTVTCRVGGPDNIHCHVYVLRNVTSTVDATGQIVLSGRSLTVSTSAATTRAGDYVLAYFSGNNSMGTFVAGAGYQDVETTISTSNDVAFSEARIGGNPGIETAMATAANADLGFVCLIVALAPS